jgi:hypothetical protein
MKEMKQKPWSGNWGDLNQKGSGKKKDLEK